jgi:hypothetical protein
MTNDIEGVSKTISEGVIDSTDDIVWTWWSASYTVRSMWAKLWNHVIRTVRSGFIGYVIRNNNNTYLLTPCSRVLFEKVTDCSQSRNFPHFMEPESSSPHSQPHATCPYPKPAPSSPHTQFPKIHPNISLPSTPRSPQWSPSLRLPHQNPVHTSPLQHTRYMPSLSHSSWFCHPHNIGWGIQIIQLFIM